MILKLTYEDQVYLGNIHLGKFINELNKEPLLCKQLLQGGNLKPFYNKIADQILSQQFCVINYNEDPTFSSFAKSYQLNKASQKNPKLFLYTFRRSKMSHDMFWSLVNDNKIPKQIVYAIKDAGYTVVRTDNPLQRNSLTALIKKYKITIKNY